MITPKRIPQRSLGIRVVRDGAAQAALKIVLEPIFGRRPPRPEPVRARREVRLEETQGDLGVTVTTVFCLPYAGGSSAAYLRWPKTIPGLDVVAVDYPGRLMRPREPVLSSVDGLASWLFEETVKRSDGPFALCGASLGGLVAFELARLAEAIGRRPSAVMVCACAAPDRPPSRPPISRMADDEFFTAVAAIYGGSALRLLEDPDAKAIALPALRADVEAFENYPRGHKEPITADLIAVSGQDDKSVTYGDVAAWTAFTMGNAKVLSVSGDHFFIHDQHELLVRQLASQIHDQSPKETRWTRKGS